MGAALIIILIIVLLWPYIMRWLQRYMMRRAEDTLRRMAGQPTRKEEQRARRRNASEQRRASDRRGTSGPKHPARMMNAVAEDVQYTEIHEYSSSSLDMESESAHGRSEYHEEQVEDVKYTEIKGRPSENGGKGSDR